MYLSSDEFLELERARLTLRAYGIGVDRGRLVREAIALLMTDLEAGIDASVIARRLRATDQPDPADAAPAGVGPANIAPASGRAPVASGAPANGGVPVANSGPVNVGAPVNGGGLINGGALTVGVLVTGIGVTGLPEGPQ